MTVIPLPIDTGSQARTILHHLLEHGALTGRDTAGGTIITRAVDDWLLERLLMFEASAEDFEDGGDSEPDDRQEDDVPPNWYCEGYGKA